MIGLALGVAAMLLVAAVTGWIAEWAERGTQ